MRVYLAGPMSGIPHNNFPAFDAAAEDLRARGYDVVSPAELDSPEERARAFASDGEMDRAIWVECMKRDLELIMLDGLEAIVVLPGWMASQGTATETFLAYRLKGLPVYHYGPVDPLRAVAHATLGHVHLTLRA